MTSSMQAILLLAVFSGVSAAALPSNLNTKSKVEFIFQLLRRSPPASAVAPPEDNPQASESRKKNVPGAVGATLAVIVIVSLAVGILMVHRGIWLKNKDLQFRRKKIFRPTVTTPEPIEMDETTRQQRYGHVVRSYISTETVCISDGESEMQVPDVASYLREHQMQQEQHRQNQRQVNALEDDEFWETDSEDDEIQPVRPVTPQFFQTVTIPLPVARRI